MSVNIKDICWLAGLLEGEGCFIISKNKTPRIQLGMCDLDVVEHAAKLLGGVTIYTAKTIVDRKTFYVLQLGGSKAIGWMMTIYQFMGERRKTKIKEILSVWKQTRSTRIRKMGETCSRGHLLTSASTYLTSTTNTLSCRDCRRINNKAGKTRRREKFLLKKVG